MRQEWLNIFMDLAEAARAHRTSSGVPIFQKRGSGGGVGGRYGFILSNYGNKQRDKSQSNQTSKQGEDPDGIFQCAKDQGEYLPEESNLKYFEEEKYRVKHNILMSSIRHINCIIARSIGTSGSKQALFIFPEY